MTTLEFLSHLRSLNVELWADGERLRCNGPKAVLTLELRAELRDRKEGILAFLRAANGEAPPVVPVSRDGDLFLSFAQQRLWFLDQLQPGSSFYNISRSLRLEGALNVEALRKSLSRIVDRHEVLRTTITVADGNPTQVVGESQPCPLTIVDLSEGPDSGRQEAVRRILDSETKRSFDLSRDLMVRATLLRLGASEHVLLLVTHHIASDGWSSGILWQELATLYAAFSRGEADPLPELPIQYADYAVWQRQWLQGEVLETQLSYWKKQLSDASVLELPTDRPRPAVQSYRGARQSSVLSKAVTDQLQALSRKEGVTLFMTLLAAFQTLLHRYSGQEDIAVGTPIAGRTRSETEGLIGFFVNTLVLRSDLSDNPTFRELLARVRKVAFEAYEHQDLPFEKLVEELHPDRDLSRSPLFQVMFVHQNVPRQSFELPGLTVSPVETHNDTAKFDLSLHTRDETQGLKASAEYNTDLFDAATVKRLLGHFEVLLEGIVANPDQRLSELPLLTEAERHQLLVEWNDTKTDYPNDKCIHELFEAQVERTPEAVAVVFEDQQLTYRELNRRANQLAYYLQKKGVGPEVLVGICVERSLEMVIGILGIIKAGGAYVPLDPLYPKERLAMLIDDLTPAVLVAQRTVADELPTRELKLLFIEDVLEDFTSANHENPQCGARPEDLAYVIYTSGSTGKPKGVMVTHRNVVRLFQQTQPWFGFGSHDVWTLFHSFAFDFSVWELWGALFFGGRLVIVPYWLSRSPEQFGDLLCVEKVTVLNQTPTAFRQLLHAIGTTGPKKLDLRWIIFGGEALDFANLRPWFELYGDEKPQLVNMYGITETTVHVTFQTLRVADLDQVTGSVIGAPIPDLHIYLLDQQKQLVPIGVPGEIYVGGAGLARGYLNRPELTAEKFISSPFSDEPGARLYKTGDLARYLPDGNIEFLGRVDHQVKIRGYRIEPGEIENVLCQHSAVREAVVVAREDMPGEKRLVGYVVPSQEPAPTTSELRVFLQQKLPDYMVPSAFVSLQSLPLTPNGKIDRRALPLPDQSRPRLEISFVAPRTQVEELIAEIWAQVLKLEQVGIEDNFFELGGHSLLAMQVVSRIRAAFEVELPLRDLFEKPTVARLAESIETAFRSGQGLATPPLVPVSRDGDLFLSFAQQRLWFLDQLQPGSSFYNISRSLRLEGALNVEALRKSLSRIVDRHEVLRTTITVADGNPTQVVGESQPCPLTIVDLSEGPDSGRQEAVRRILDSETKRSFDLSRDLMVRATLLRLGASEHVLLLVTHHIASDGWSSEILWQELATLYAAFSRGEPDPLPELPIQYADYAVWQRQWLQGEVLETQLSYWTKKLSHASVLELPTDRPRLAVQSYRGARQSSVLSKAVTDQLQALSRKEGVTLFMTLLAAFQTLLHRYSGQEDIAVGTPIAGRTRSETEGLIGFFVNTLVLRSDLSDNPTFRELLARVRKVAFEAYEHQDLPFEKLVEELHPDRDLSRSPLFQVMFVHQNVPRQSFELPGLTVSPVETHNDTAKFDLSLHTRDETQGLKASAEYNTDLFDAATVKRLLGHFEVLLEGIVANPDQRLSELPLLTEAERHQLLVEWNDTKTDYPNDKCIHELFEAQVERTPEAVAVVFEDQQLTYRELNRRANQLAHYLQKKGVGPEVLVGICVERSLEMVIGLLGILKSGGAYVPLDPTYPGERLAFMLEDSQASVLLTQKPLLEKFPERRCEAVCLDSDLGSHEPEENPIGRVKTQDLAYVMYTSGSTGKPKGVAVPHQAVSRLVINTAYVNLNACDVVAQVSNPSFDAATFEIWGAILNGSKLVGTTTDVILSPEHFASQIERNKISVLFLTTALFNQMARERPALFKHVRHLLFGGEAADPRSVSQILKHGCPERLLHVYGPTETTTFANWYLVKSVSEGAITIPIGRPIASTEVYVLDRHLGPVPMGVPGELYIGGAGLARGYLNRPELTAEKFISSPFSDEPGARLYKTGDLARYLPDGNIEFLGRVDHQVKIRGYRIEPGEIENVLCQHSAVREAVVVAREDMPGEKRLVGYVVPSQEPAPTTSELRVFLQQKLPDYMVPSAFVSLQSLPLTPNGKIDRRALPLPDQSRPRLEISFVAPRTQVEELIAEIWAQVLKLEQVGIEDNFFELGGHSLLAMQVVSRIRAAFEVELPLRDLFEKPTVARLAESIETAFRSGQGLATPPLVPVSRDGDLFLSFAQQRLWFLDQLVPGSIAYNISKAVRLTGPLNVVALEQSLNEIRRRHEILRTTFGAIDGKPFQTISPAKPFILPVTDLQHFPETEREVEAQKQATEEARQPFDLNKGPLFRAILLRLGEEDHVFLFIMHHIVSDGWSMGVFFRELTTLYEVFSSGKPSSLAELPIQYVDFAYWQRQWLQGDVLETQLSYWKEQLQAVPVLQLPTDRPRPAVQTFRGARQTLVLPRSLADALKRLSHQEGVTLFMTLLAAFKTLLCRYTGQEDIVVGTPIASRNRAEIEPLIGFFINTLALRTDLSGDSSFRELLRRVREVTLGAYAHQDLPFEKLVEELQPERDLSRTPLFQVFFNMLNLEGYQLKVPGVSIEPWTFSEPDSKFDLTLYASEKNEEVHLNLVYNTDLFGQDRMVEMLGQLEQLLWQIVTNPEGRIAELTLLSPRAKTILPNPIQPLVSDWEGSVCTRLSCHARRVPDRPAIEDRQETWSYRELDSRSNQLANYLLAHNVGSQDVVALYGCRNVSLVWALLGILKAGAAFVILEPAYPVSRLISYLMASKPQGWIQLGAAGEPPDALRECVERQNCRIRLELPQGTIFGGASNGGEVLGDYSTEDPKAEVGPDDLAYLTFTSGTTGQPKGILGTHRPLSHFLQWHSQTFGLNESDRFSMLSGISHDPLLRDIFTPLWLGATLLIPSPEELDSPHDLVKWIKGKAISIAHLTPAMSQLMGESGPENYNDKNLLVSSLRYAFFGGDVLTKHDLARFQNIFPSVGCVNFYGATETPQAVGYFIVPNQILHDAFETSKEIIPLGRGTKNIQLLVLTTFQRLAGVGELGEIYIRAPYLAKGYLDDPLLTQQRFVVNPYTEVSSDRLYRTGDLARYLPDGNVEFFGRKDQQVKLRGFRIELGEIEATLSHHPDVGQVVVMAREDGLGEKRLVAYVVPSQEPAPTTSELRVFLQQRLPDYMVPSTFVMLDALPLTPNGKLDRRALPVSDQSRPVRESSFVAPRTQVEELIAEIWAQVLKLEQVSIEDNFFELGGHSLLAAQMFARLEECLKIRLPLAILFQTPTIEGLAAAIGKGSASQSWRSLVTIQPAGIRPPLFAVPGLGGNVLCYNDLARLLGPEQPFYGLQSRGLSGTEKPLTSIEEIAGAFLEEIREVQPKGPYYLAGACMGGVVAFEMAQQLRAAGQDVGILILLEALVPVQTSMRRLRPAGLTLNALHLIVSRLHLYIQTLTKLHGRQRFEYLLGRLNMLKQMIAQRDLFRGDRSEFYSRVVTHANRAALRKYQPHIYPGQIVLFRAEGRKVAPEKDRRLAWNRLAAGGAEIHSVPGNDSGLMLIKPNVQVLAPQVKACLEHAQALASMQLRRLSVPRGYETVHKAD